MNLEHSTFGGKFPIGQTCTGPGGTLQPVFAQEAPRVRIKQAKQEKKLETTKASRGKN